MTARMLGAMRPPWCPVCKSAPGPDCPDIGRGRRAQRAAERRQWLREARDDR